MTIGELMNTLIQAVDCDSVDVDTEISAFKKEKSVAEYLAFGETLCEDKNCKKCALLPLCLKYDTTPKIISKYLNDMKQILD